MSSHDLNFKRECFSLLGLPECGKDIIENCIKDKIISVVATNDTSNRRTNEALALFVDQEAHDPEEEYEGAGNEFEFEHY